MTVLILKQNLWQEKSLLRGCDLCIPQTKQGWSQISGLELNEICGGKKKEEKKKGLGCKWVLREALAHSQGNRSTLTGATLSSARGQLA